MAQFDQNQLMQLLLQNHITSDEWTVLCVLGYGPSTRRCIVRTATSESVHGSTDSDYSLKCQHAINNLLKRKWLARVTSDMLLEMQSELRKSGTSDPVYGYPAIDDIDFTPQGAIAWRNVFQQLQVSAPRWKAQVRSDDSREFKIYCTSLRAASQIQKHCAPHIGTIKELGRWCVYWWYRFPRGYVISFVDWPATQWYSDAPLT
jgi:hypothetical protein